MAELRQIAHIDQGQSEHSRSSFHLVTLSPCHLVKTLLAVLFLGPLIAPLFQATRLPLVADSGALARDLLARYICPTPAKSYMLLGFPMAVCARCWGATIGLWAAWLLLRRLSVVRGSWSVVNWTRTNADERGRRTTDDGRWTTDEGRGTTVSGLQRDYLNLPWLVRLLVGALPFLLWVAEISLWPAAPYWVLLLNGAFAGFWAGQFFYSIWPGIVDT